MSHSAWHQAIKEELPAGYSVKFNYFMDQVYGQGKIYCHVIGSHHPNDSPLGGDVKVVILIRSYHGPSQGAQGLSFSVPNDLPAPSLQNILKELGRMTLASSPP